MQKKKTARKRLALSKETLATLTNGDMRKVVGGDIILGSPTGWYCTRYCDDSITTE
jgi:hypothetical protein